MCTPPFLVELRSRFADVKRTQKLWMTTLIKGTVRGTELGLQEEESGNKKNIRNTIIGELCLNIAGTVMPVEVTDMNKYTTR